MATYQEVQCKEFGECMMDMKTAKQILKGVHHQKF